MTNLNPRLLSRRQLSEYLNVSPSTVSEWVQRGIIPPCVKGTRYWDKQAVDKHLDNMLPVVDPPSDPYDAWKLQHAGS